MWIKNIALSFPWRNWPDSALQISGRNNDVPCGYKGVAGPYVDHAWPILLLNYFMIMTFFFIFAKFLSSRH